MPTKKYKIDGKRVPGVTTVIGTSLGWGKEGLLHWANELGLQGKSHREERDNAASAGTIAHAMAEADIKSLPHPRRSETDDPILWAKATEAFGAYLAWKRMTRLELVGSELSLISPTLRCGGTLDAVAKIEGELALIDFKTSNHTHPEHVIQISAYDDMWRNGLPFECEIADRQPFSGIHLLRFSKAGDFHHSYWAAKRMEKPFRAFQILRELYDLKKVIEEMV